MTTREYRKPANAYLMIEVLPEGNHAVQELTQAYTAALESIILQYPEQYFWFHRRWKTRPPGTTAGV